MGSDRLTCPRCGKHAGMRDLTTDRPPTSSGWFPCPHPCHAAARDVVDAAVAMEPTKQRRRHLRVAVTKLFTAVEKVPDGE